MISQKSNFGNHYFFNVNFSITIAHTEFKLCLVIFHTNSEGTVSQMSDFDLSFYSMLEIGKHFVKSVNITL